MYNNPYIINSGLRGASSLGKAGLFSSIRGLNWGNLLSNTQKTLGIINQAIPIVYQVKPIMNNARTMFRVMGAMKEDEPLDQYSMNQREEVATRTNSVEKEASNQPMFFI